MLSGWLVQDAVSVIAAEMVAGATGAKPVAPAAVTTDWRAVMPDGADSASAAADREATGKPVTTTAAVEEVEEADK